MLSAEDAKQNQPTSHFPILIPSRPLVWFKKEIISGENDNSILLNHDSSKSGTSLNPDKDPNMYSDFNYLLQNPWDYPFFIGILGPQAASTPELLEAAGRSPKAHPTPSAAGAAGRLSEECQVCGIHLGWSMFGKSTPSMAFHGYPI